MRAVAWTLMHLCDYSFPTIDGWWYSIHSSKATMSDEWDVKICCMGAGYVGGPTMAVIAKQCPKVRPPTHF